MKKTYSEKLLDPRWQRKRLEILSRDEFYCQKCCDDTNTLHVHHKYYLRNAEPWEYDDEMLITLCKDCHEYETKSLEVLKNTAIENMQKSGFFLTDIEMIIKAISMCPIKYASEVTTAAILHHLSSFDNVSNLVTDYLNSLSKKRNGKNKNNKASVLD